MFAAKMGFYRTALGPAQSPYWVAVFDDFIPNDIAVGDIGDGKDYSILAGHSGTGATSRGALYRFDQLGNVVYQNQMSTAGSSLNSIITNGDQKAMVVGETKETGSTRPYVAVYNSNGSLAWEKYDNTSGLSYNKVEFQESPTTFNVVAVGGGGSTPGSRYMRYDYTTGAIYSQDTFATLYNIQDTSIVQNGGYFPSYNVAIDTTQSYVAYDALTVLVMDKSNTVNYRRYLGLTGATPSNPRILYRAFRVHVSYTLGGYPNIIQFGSDAGSTPPGLTYVGTLAYSGQIVGPLMYNRNTESAFYCGATQTNGTMWTGLEQEDLTNGYPTQQTNFYFGTPGTNYATMNGFATTGNGSYLNPARYIVGTTDYYGTTKGFIARLPKDGTIPGSGTYGASSEIHYTTSSYMNYRAETTLTSGTRAGGKTTTTDTIVTSTETSSATTNTLTLNQVS